MLWISTLGPRERLIMLRALQFAFRRLENDREWADLIRATCEAVQPSPAEDAEITVVAGRVAAGIKAELAKAA